ncbi:hypothetical protein FKM82_007221 [Ascaphus truei]
MIRRAHSAQNMARNFPGNVSEYRSRYANVRSNSVSQLVAKYENALVQKPANPTYSSQCEQKVVDKKLSERKSLLQIKNPELFEHHNKEISKRSKSLENVVLALKVPSDTSDMNQQTALKTNRDCVTQQITVVSASTEQTDSSSGFRKSDNKTSIRHDSKQVQMLAKYRPESSSVSEKIAEKGRTTAEKHQALNPSSIRECGKMKAKTQEKQHYEKTLLYTYQRNNITEESPQGQNRSISSVRERSALFLLKTAAVEDKFRHTKPTFRKTTDSFCYPRENKVGHATAVVCYSVLQ